MSKLTDYLRALMATRTTPAEAAHSASPGEVVTLDSGTSFYVAPSDGIAVLTGVDSQDGAWGGIACQRTNISSPIISTTRDQTLTAFIPVAKGDSVNFSIGGFTSTKMFFVRLMGGGSLALIGGGLCLSHFLERSAKRLLAMPSLQVRKSLSPLKGKLGGKVSPLPMMGTFLSTPTAQRLQLKLAGDADQQLLKRTTVLREFQSLLAKVSPLFSTLKEHQHRKAKPISSLQSLPFNLSFGGAL